MPESEQPRERSEPRATRPHMPGYGILDESSDRGLLPWAWATERLAQSHNYWVATTRPDSRPHVMPVWGVWLNDAFYFSTGRDSRKVRNLAANPHCVVCTERADEAVIVEGMAAEVSGSAEFGQFAAAYNAKYQWAPDPDEGPVYVVRPQVAFGFIENEDDFPGSATRWLFD